MNVSFSLTRILETHGAKRNLMSRVAKNSG